MLDANKVEMKSTYLPVLIMIHLVYHLADVSTGNLSVIDTV